MSFRRNHTLKNNNSHSETANKFHKDSKKLTELNVKFWIVFSRKTSLVLVTTLINLVFTVHIENRIIYLLQYEECRFSYRAVLIQNQFHSKWLSWHLFLFTGLERLCSSTDLDREAHWDSHIESTASAKQTLWAHRLNTTWSTEDDQPSLIHIQSLESVLFKELFNYKQLELIKKGGIVIMFHTNPNVHPGKTYLWVQRL